MSALTVESAECAVQQVQPEMQLLLVTPRLAKSWLESNVQNRPLSKLVVQKYAKDMRTGNWRNPTGEPLIFDSNGVLQQGQHRLSAMIEADVSLQFWVLFNANPQDFHVIDSGVKRNVGQVLAIKGYSYANQLAAISRMILWMQTGVLREITPSQVITFVEQNSEVLQDAVLQSRQAYAIGLPKSAYGAVAFQVMDKSVEHQQWLDFHQDVCKGEMLTTGHPAFALRRWAMNRQALRGGNGQFIAAMVVAKAWNYFATNRDIEVLVYRRSEGSIQALPCFY